MGNGSSYSAGTRMCSNSIRCSRLRIQWDAIITGALDSVKSAVEALLIILCVGMLIGSWVWAGTMPAMVYYGLKFISPSVFLALGLVLTAIVRLANRFLPGLHVTGTVGVAHYGCCYGSWNFRSVGSRYDCRRCIHQGISFLRYPTQQM